MTYLFSEKHVNFTSEKQLDVYDLGRSFFCLYRASSDTLATFTTLKRTPGISPTAWPFLPNPATSTSSFSYKHTHTIYKYMTVLPVSTGLRLLILLGVSSHNTWPLFLAWQVKAVICSLWIVYITSSWFNKKCIFLFKSSKEPTLDVIGIKIVDIQNGTLCGSMLIMGVTSVLLPITWQLRNFTKEENRDFSAFWFSLQLMLEQALTNLIVCLTISQNYIQNCTNELACCSGY